MATPTAMLDLITSQGAQGVRVKWFYRDDSDGSVITPSMLTNGSYLQDATNLYHQPSNTANTSTPPAFPFTPTMDTDGGFYVDVNFDNAAPTGVWTVKTTFTWEGVTRTQYLGFVVTAGGATVSPASTYYCTPLDVSQVLQKAVPAANASEGDPSLGYWQTVILSVQDEIDRLTRQAWRETRVTQEIPYDGLTGLNDFEGFIFVPLRKMHVKDLSSAQGDKLEVWNGNQYEDWLQTHTEGRQADWYLNNEAGHLHLRTRVVYGQSKERVRVTYRYGNTNVPPAIRRATALMAAAELAVGQVESQHGSGSGLNQVTQDRRVDLWREQAMRLLIPYAAVEGL